MELKKVYFDAYKSLLDTELEITDNCIGLVGINESGKSNILNAIGVLSHENALTIADTPRMEKRNPALRFEFEPNDDEREAIRNSLAEWFGQEDVPAGTLPADYTVVYHVLFDRDKREETRHFTIQGVSLPIETMVLKADARTERCIFMRGDRVVPLKSVVLTNEKELGINEELAGKSALANELNEQIEELNVAMDSIRTIEQVEGLKSLDAELAETEAAQESDGKDRDASGAKDAGASVELQKKETELARVIKHKESLEAKLGEFNVGKKISEIERSLNQFADSIQAIQSEIDSTKAKIAELQNVETPSGDQTKELKQNKKKLPGLKVKLQKDQEAKVDLERAIEALRQPLREKYSSEPEELSRHLRALVQTALEPHLPNVILWKHSKAYILQGKTEFNEMLEAEGLNKISRPLVNLFRIGLKIETIEALKTAITEIRDDRSERRRYEDKLDKRINKYIQSVWEDYDQRIKISLEQERILVQFYDPKCDSASYYEMQERSQGCQTFISFLLTVGAEAKHGVIRDTVLLLDEPETHLHPSGVRFMLQELIKAANNGNKVVFATHSIFMIDRDCYNRHVIVTKKKERTIVRPSLRDRIGLFMQEEVLYTTLDIDLNKDFDSTNLYNFVFEGDGDARLFRQFYDLLEKGGQPFKLDMTSFYHGGKCSDIEKYFASKPIQLGSYWVFILDSDPPAAKLRSFLEGRYRSFVNEYIFVFQYSREEWPEEKVEMEDLLPEALVKQAIEDAASKLVGNTVVAAISAKVKNSIPFGAYFKEICSSVKEACSSVSDVEQFKGAVKSALNRRIAEQIGEAKEKAEFDKQFSVYSSWTQTVIDSISSSLKTDVKQTIASKKVKKDD